MEWKREIVWTDGAMQHTSHQAVFQWINRNQISRWIALHRFCARLPLGRERKGIGGWRGKEGTRRGDYRRHCSLCERLSLARQGGGTLWILMNWQDSPQHQLHLRAMRTTWGRRRRWLGRYSLSMAKQTEQVIFPVIIIAITMHEGLEMDLLILHALQKQPPCLSKRKAWWCGVFFAVGGVTLVRVAARAWKGQQGNLAFEEEVNEWTSLLRSIPVRPPGVRDVLPGVKLPHSPNIPNKAQHEPWGRQACKLK